MHWFIAAERIINDKKDTKWKKTFVNLLPFKGLIGRSCSKSQNSTPKDRPLLKWAKDWTDTSRLTGGPQAHEETHRTTSHQEMPMRAEWSETPEDGCTFSLSFSWVETEESCGNFSVTFSFLKVVILLFKFFRYIYFKYMGILSTCTICRLCTYNSHRGWRRHQIPWDWICRWLCVAMGMLGIESRSSIGVVSALNLWAIFSSPLVSLH